MNREHKELTERLADILCESTLLWMTEVFKKTEEETTDLIGLILSSHLSSAFTLMKTFSSEYEEVKKEVDTFISKLMKAISEINPIKNIEVH